MSSFKDFSEIIKYNNEELVVHLKIEVEDTLYYVCEEYSVFEKIGNNFEEVKNKRILRNIENLITLKKDKKYGN